MRGSESDIVGVTPRVPVRRSRAGVLILLTVILVITIIAATALGPAGIGFGQVLRMAISGVPWLGNWVVENWPAAHEVIIFRIRLPRVFLAGTIGAGLATAGVTFQALFKNPMADPYLIGISSGASLGAAVGIILRTAVPGFGFSGVTLLAFLAAVGTATLVYRISRIGGRASVASLLLAGVAVSALLTALVSLLMVLSSNDLSKIALWMMGSLSGRDWRNFWAALPFVVLGIAVCMFFARDLNVLLLGDEEASQLGIEVERLKLVLLAIGSLMAAAAVANSGVIGFVGLIVPHAVRLVVGPDHRLLLPTSCLIGAIFLIAADTLARTLLGGVELPVGIITALCGAPFFLYLLRRSRLGAL